MLRMPEGDVPGAVGAQAIRLAPYFRVWWNQLKAKEILENFHFDPEEFDRPLNLRVGEAAILFVVEQVVLKLKAKAGESASQVTPSEFIEQLVHQYSLMGESVTLHGARQRGWLDWNFQASYSLETAGVAKLRYSVVPPAIQLFCKLVGV